MGGLVSTLTVRLQDDVSGAAGKAAASLKNLSTSGKDLERLNAINPQIGKLTKQLDALHGQAAKVGAFREASRSLDVASTTFRRSRQEVTRLTAELDKAKSKAEALKGVKGETEARKAADADVRRLTRELRTATTAQAESRAAFVTQGRAARALGADLAAAGVPVKQLAAHERQLAANIQATTAALKQQKQAAAAALAQQAQRAGRPNDRRGGIMPFLSRRNGPAGRHDGGRGAEAAGLGGAIGAYTAAEAYKQAAAFDRRLTLIGQTADASRSEIDGLSRSLHTLAQETATPVDKLADGLEALVAQGRNLKDAKDFLPSVARTATATGSAVDDIAKSADAVGSNIGVAGKEMQTAFDIMAAGGKAGSFELKDMARYLPSLAPAAKAAGLAGQKGLADIIAMLQIVRKGSGTAEEAATSMGNILTKMESKETKKNFKEMGVDLEAAMKKGRQEGRNLIEVLEEATAKATKGDLSLIPRLFPDSEFARGMRAIAMLRGEWQKMSTSLQNTSAGTVGKDFAWITKDAQANLDRLQSGIKDVTSSLLRLSEAGGVNAGLGNLAKEFGEIADFMDRINSAYDKGGIKGLLGQVTDDATDRLREKRKEWNDKHKKDESGRIDELEADNKAFRAKLEKEGHSPESIAKTMKLRERDVERARQRYEAAAKASRDRRKFDPPAIAPSSPEASSTAGVPSLIDAASKNKPPLPFPQKPTPIPDHAKPQTVPLPPRRPVEFGGTPAPPQQVTVNGEVSGNLTGDMTGTATVSGQAHLTVTVNASSQLIAIENSLQSLAVEMRGEMQASAQARSAIKAQLASAQAAGGGARAGTVRSAMHNLYTNTA